MALSVVNPVGSAFERMKVILFQPFDISKWFVLGFCAFLAYFGQGGGGANPIGQWQNGQESGPSASEIARWVESNIGMILVGGLLLSCVVLLLLVVVTWLSSRGKFMFLDGVVRNRAAVVEPWKVFGALANSLTGARVALAMASWLTMLVLLVIAAYIVWPDLRADEFGGRAVTGLIFFVVGFFSMGLVFGVLGMVIEDFVTPAMYLTGLPFVEAWRLVMTEVVGGSVGTIVLYFIMKIVIGIAVGVISVVAVCATCCIAAIPYLGTVILLPVYVFLRCYSLCFLEQLGPDWRFFVEERPVVTVLGESPPEVL
jgi:hypothetical protein